MFKSLTGLIFSLIGGLSVAVLLDSFGPKIIGMIIFSLMFIAILLHLFRGLRNRIKIKIIKQSFHDPMPNIRFEAINLSEKPNSLQEKVYFKCLLPSIHKSSSLHGESFKLVFHVKENDRILEPHKSKIFTAYSKSSNTRLGFSWFRKYEFQPSRGMSTNIFVRNSLDNGIAFWKYRIERSLYRLFRVVNEKKEVITE